MNIFTIEQMSNLSGLPDTTILFWQKKYNIFPDIPVTKDKKFKYNSQHLNRLLNIATLFHLNKKYALENICGLDDEILKIKVEVELMSNLITKQLNEDIINQLIASILTYDNIRFNLILDSAIKKLTTQEFYKIILFPFFIRILESFYNFKDLPVQFYFMNSLIVRKLHFLIQLKPSSKTKKEKVLLFLPEKEFNEIGLLFLNLLFNETGFETIYLGPNIKFSILEQAIKDLEPDLIFTFNTDKPKHDTYNNLIKNLGDDLNKLYLVGREEMIESYKLPRNQKFYNIDEYMEFTDQFNI